MRSLIPHLSHPADRRSTYVGTVVGRTEAQTVDTIMIDIGITQICISLIIAVVGTVPYEHLHLLFPLEQLPQCTVE
jgi:hypothetical protein